MLTCTHCYVIMPCQSSFDPDSFKLASQSFFPSWWLHWRRAVAVWVRHEGGARLLCSSVLFHFNACRANMHSELASICMASFENASPTDIDHRYKTKLP